MRWSPKIGRVFGIDIHLHFTFLLLLAFLGFVVWSNTQSIEAAIRGVAFIVALFGCVVLHEFGHALTARRYGIKTRDITLLPIGGVARLEKMPEDPFQELWVALAGPAVNVVIAAVLFALLSATGNLSATIDMSIGGGQFWQRLMLINIALVVFNLLPAFPMDGGRVLRALLAMRLGRLRATTIAANVGQGMAILLGVVGFFYNPFLIFIAIFVYLGAQAEAGMTEMQSAITGLRVRDAMITEFRTLDSCETHAQAVEELLAGSQQDFPVVENDRPVGILRRNDLVKALSQGRLDSPVTEGMCCECDTVDESASLKETVDLMRSRRCSAVPVVSNGHVCGLLTLEHVGEFIMVNSAMNGQAGERSRQTVPGRALHHTISSAQTFHRIEPIPERGTHEVEAPPVLSGHDR